MSVTKQSVKIASVVVLAVMALQAQAVDLVTNFSPPLVQGEVNSVAQDANFNTFVAGTFRATVDFNPKAGADVKTHLGNGDAFVTRYNSDGTYAWTQTFGGTQGELGRFVVVAGSSVFLVCDVNSTDAGVGGTAGTYSIVGTQTNTFVIKLDAATGAPVTAFGTNGVQRFGGTGPCFLNKMLTDGTHIYLCGALQGGDAGVGSPITQATAPTGNNGFVVCLDATTGAAVPGFGKNGILSFGGAGHDECNDFALQGSNLYIMGVLNSADATLNGVGKFSSAKTNIASAYMLAVDATSGAAVTTFGTSGLVTFGGTTAFDSPYSMTATPTTIYFAGIDASHDAKLNKTGTAYDAANLGQQYIVALDATTGAGVSGFGNGGVYFPNKDVIQEQYIFEMQVTGGSLFVGGYASTNRNSVTQNDGFIEKHNAATGALDTTFGHKGIQYLGGTGNDYVTTLLASGSSLIVGGKTASADFGIGAPGSVDATNFGGFVVGLDTTRGFAVGSSPPVFGSELSATPNPISIGLTTTISASATAGAAISYNFDFNDNSTLLNQSNSSTQHTFSQYGDYTVVLAASSNSQTAFSETIVHVGYPSASFPGALKLSGTLNLIGGKDALKLSGTLPVAQAFSPLNSQVFITIGGFQTIWNLDAAGKATLYYPSRATGKLAIGFTFKKNAQGVNVVQANPAAKFSMSLSKATIASALKDEGIDLTKDQSFSPPVKVLVGFNNADYVATHTTTFASKKGKGTLK